LIANALRKENIFLTATAEDGTATIKQIEESVHGRGADQLLLSSYFGLQSTLPPSLEATSKTLFAKAAEGDSKAALAFIEQLSAPPQSTPELVPAIAEALKRDSRKSSAHRDLPKRAAKRTSSQKRSTKKKIGND
jgi:hypothetical protein